MTRYKKTMSEAYREVYNLSEKMSSSQIAKLKKAYEPMRGKKISSSNAEKLMKIMDMVDKDKNVLIQLFKADIPFVSELAVTRLITKHKMKGAEINKLKSEALDKEDEPKVKELIKKLKGASQAHAGQAKDLEKALKEEPEHEVTVGNYTTKFFHMCGSAQTTMKKHASKDGAEELAKMQDMFYKMEKDAMESGSVSDEQKEKAQALYDKIMSKAKDVGIEDEVGKYMKMHLDSMLKGNPKLGFGRTDVQSEAFASRRPGNQMSDLYKLYSLAMKSVPGSKQQKELEKKISSLRKELKLDESLDEAMLNLATVKFQAKDKLGKIAHRVTQKGKKYIISVDSNDEEDAQKAMKDHPLYVAGKLRVVPEEVELDEVINEGTWALPDSPKAKAELKKLMSKPIKLGKEGDDATDIMYSLIGDDELFDDLYVAGKKNPNGDARPVIKKAMKRLGIKEEVELDESKKALKAKSDKSGVSVGILSKVYDRGMAAWKGGHRPGTTPQQWALARVNSFLTGGGARKADNDLWQKAKGQKKAKKEEVQEATYRVVVDGEGVETVTARTPNEAEAKALRKMGIRGTKGKTYKSKVKVQKINENIELDEAKATLSRFGGDRLKSSIMNLAKQKGLKVKDSGKDKLEISGNGKVLMGLTLAVQKKDVKINEDAVKSAQMKLDKAKKIQDLKDKISDIRGEGARADAMRAMRRKRSIDPADVDTDATDDDMKAASKNIMMQLRKSISLGKSFKVEFGDKKKMSVDPKIAQAVTNKYMSFRKPMDKEKFQSKIAKSYKDMLSALKENIHEEEEKPDNTKFTDRIKKAQERVRNATKGTQEHGDALDALQNAKDAYANYKKKTAGGKLKSTLKKTAIATGIGAIATAKLGDSYDPKIKRETILDRIDKKLEEKKNG